MFFFQFLLLNVLFLLSAVRWSSAVIKLGLVESDPRLVGICQKALNDAKSAGKCVQEEIQLLNVSSGCGSLPWTWASYNQNHSTTLGTVHAAELYFRQQVQALISSRCAEEARELGRLAYHWRLPVLNRVGTILELFRRQLFPSLVQCTDTNVAGMGLALAQLMALFNQTQIILVGPKQVDIERPPLMPSVRAMLELVLMPKNMSDDISNSNSNSNGPVQYVELDEGSTDSQATAVQKIRSPVKMLAIDSSFVHLESVLSALQVGELGGSQGYLLVLLCADPVESCLLNGSISLRSILVTAGVAVLAPYNADWAQQMASLKQQAEFEEISQANFLPLVSTYNACYGFCLASSLTSIGSWTSDPGNPSFVANMRAQTFQGSFGNIQLDQWPAQLVQFGVYIASASASVPQLLYIANSTASESCATNYTCFDVKLALASSDGAEQQLWNSQRSQALSECFYRGGCGSSAPWFIVAICLVLLVFAAAIIYGVQRKKRLDVFRMHWKIGRQQLKVIENKQSKGKATGLGQEGAWSKRRQLQAYALIGTNKAEFLVLRQLRKISWDKADMRFIFELKRLNHDNLTTLIGICYNDGDLFYICHSLVERGTLDDYINDLDFHLDNTFRSAFLRDILRGIQYLHKSSVGYHGLLCLHNVLIDSNWVLKLTNFGIGNLLNKAIEREQLKLIELIPLTTYLTVAPENLGDVAYGREYPRGSAPGDLYAFGMLMYHILFRLAPFERTTLSAKEIIEEVKRRNLKPVLENTLPEEKPLVDAMEQCWQKNPELRPKLRHLSQVFSTVFQASQGNLIDQMRRMNEKHALNLEKLVAQRNAELAVAREETERLLHEMLPPSIAKQLKEQKAVEPRSYESATVLFCQLVDFSTVLGKFPPNQVIDFLNQVFSTFDQIIRNHDAYKVETTGETYMVASGVPNENASRHVFEISEVALEFREASYTYKAANFPDWKLLLRIGYHCGPIAAGVIGLKAPRYCLFGDTVNFASRMQSNAAPNQIQMSEGTAKMLMAVTKYRLTKRGIVKVKGKGEVNTYWLNEWRDDPQANLSRLEGGSSSSSGTRCLQTAHQTQRSTLGLLNDANCGGTAAGGISDGALMMLEGLRNRKSSMGKRRGSTAD